VRERANRLSPPPIRRPPSSGVLAGDGDEGGARHLGGRTCVAVGLVLSACRSRRRLLYHRLGLEFPLRFSGGGGGDGVVSGEDRRRIGLLQAGFGVGALGGASTGSPSVSFVLLFIFLRKVGRFLCLGWRRRQLWTAFPAAGSLRRQRNLSPLLVLVDGATEIRSVESMRRGGVLALAYAAHPMRGGSHRHGRWSSLGSGSLRRPESDKTRSLW